MEHREGCFKKPRPLGKPEATLTCRRLLRGSSCKEQMRQRMENETPHGVSDEWSPIPWRKLERYLYRLQKRIYQAKQRGDTRAVRGLKRMLKRSKAAKTLAVRQGTQDNRGKSTAGVDGVKNLNPTARLAMATTRSLKGKASPARRVWIPKPGKDEKRPLGIPTMMERAKQA